MDATEIARLIGVACGMRTLLATIAADISQPRLYRREAAELLALWNATPRIVVGEQRPAAAIIETPDLLGLPELQRDDPPAAAVKFVRRRRDVTSRLAAIRDHLAQHGPCTAEQVAAALGVSRPSMYRALKSIDLVSTGRHPARYHVAQRAAS